MSNSVLIDQNIRDEIYNNFSDNLFITAGAGTGKTHSIVKRISNAVKQGIAPEKIVVTTFTEKAANELIYKVRKQIEIDLPEQLLSIQNMFIGTLHSFCLMILKERPLESKIDIDINMLDEETEEIARNTVINKIIDQKMKNDDFRNITLQYEFDPYTADEYFRTIYTYRDLTPVNVEIIDLDKTIEKCEELIEYIPILINKNQQPDAEDIHIFQDIYDVWKNHKENKDTLISKIVDIQIPKPKKKSWSNLEKNDEIFEDISLLLYDNLGRTKSIASFLVDIINEIVGSIKLYVSAFIYNIYKNLYNEFEIEYSNWKNHRGLVDFTDMLLKAREIVKNNREVREYFQNRFELFIIDEFQDTDPIMCELLMYICQNYYSDVLWNEVELKPGKITVVGDEKQSIYRFRRADISIFNRCKKIFEKQGKILTLKQNFRSQQPLLEQFNNSFNTLFNNNDDVIAYNSLNAHRLFHLKENDKNIIFLDLNIDLNIDSSEHWPRGNENKGLKTAFIKEREPYTISKWIKNTVENKLLLLENKNIKYGDILLLFRRRAIMNIYAKELVKQNIPVAMGGEGFILELPEVMDLFRYYKGIVMNNDALSVIGALRSVYCGITDNDIYEHKVNKGSFLVYADNTEKGNKKVNNALIILKGYCDSIRKMTVKDSFSYILDQTSVRYVLNQTQPILGLNIYESIIELFNSYCSLGLNAFDVITKIFNELLLEDSSCKKCDPSYYPLEPQNEVRLMTVHQSKGLESKVVILCDVSYSGNSMQNHVIFDREKDQLYFKFGVEKRGVYKNAEYRSYKYQINSKEFNEHNEIEKQQQEYEDLRLKYVAATRARDYLIIPTYRNKPSKYYKDLFEQLSLTNEYFQISSEQLQQDNIDSSLPKPAIYENYNRENTHILSDISKFTEQREKIIEKIKHNSQKTYTEKTFSDHEQLTRDEKGYGSYYGSFFHKFMELLLKRSLGKLFKTSDELLEFAEKHKNSIKQQICYDQKFRLSQELSDVFEQHVKNTLSHENILECFNSLKRYAEITIGNIQTKDDIYVHYSGIIDLLYKKDNIWNIVDFKTDKITSDEIEEKLLKSYEHQIKSYIDVFKKITGEDVVGNIVFVDKMI